MAATPVAAPAVILHSDLPLALQEFAVKKARDALATVKVDKDLAQIIKKALEDHTGGLWHVVVGTSFGLSVSHDNHALLLFKLGKANILAFQSFDESALVRKDGAAQMHRKVERKTDEDDEGGDAP